MYELTGRLSYGLTFTAQGNPVISLELNEKMAAVKLVDELHDEKLSIKVCKFDEKRSLNANSYYWSLLGKLCKALKISRNYCHNLMLRRYGVLEEFDGQVAYWVIQDTDEASKKADEAEHYHIKPTSSVRVGNDGLMYRTYLLLKGSHGYTKQEFTALLEGLIDECRHVGIETATPEELARMMSLYKEKANEEYPTN
jgi:hypothetical protein